MEKVIYLLWCDSGGDIPEFGQKLRSDLVPQLLDLDACGLQLNIADESVRAAAPAMQGISPRIDAFVSVWMPSANAAGRRAFDDAIQRTADRYAAYLVTESQPLANTRYPARPGLRTEGFAQIALFQQPLRLSRRAWLDIWLDSHTQIAIDTQDTFLYVQNIVVRALTDDAPLYDAIVEEGFPVEAFGSSQGFYDAHGDEEKHLRNQEAMMESCRRFIDFDRIDVVQTSQYLIKSPAC